MQGISAMPASTLDLRSEYQLPKVIPQIDRLRGLAILLVLVCHSQRVMPPVLSGIARQCWMGVDLFFVLSGFLITGILWETRSADHYFKRFYARRALRIWPVYLLCLFFVFCIVSVFKPLVAGIFGRIPKDPLGLWVYLLMIQNLFGDRLFLSQFLPVTWSLATEEQFYLLWPAVIRRASWRVLLPFLFAGLLLAPFLRLWAAHHGFSPIAIYYNPLTHCDALLWGAIIAIWLRSIRERRGTLLAAGVVLIFAGAALFVPIYPYSVASQHCSPLVFTAVALMSAGILLVALVSENLGVYLHRFFFMNQTLSFFGLISYSLYLYHLPVLRFFASDKLAAKINWWHQPDLTERIMFLFGIVMSIVLAWISRVTVERVALSKKYLFDS